MSYDDLNVQTGVRTQTVDHGDGTGTRTIYDPDGTVNTIEQLTGLPIVDIDTSHASDDPLAAEVARLSSLLEAVLADPEIAKVADIEAIRTAAEGTKDDDALVLAVAKVLGADPNEDRKKRDENPQWFADVVEKYGLGRDPKADSTGWKRVT